MEIKLLGITDDVNECNCCGKTNLKCTVAFEIDGAEAYYGTTCATYFYGKDWKTIKKEIETDKARRTNEAYVRLRSTPEYLTYDACIRELNKDAGTPGHLSRRMRILLPLIEDLNCIIGILKSVYRIDHLTA